MENISITIGKMHNIDLTSANLSTAINQFQELFRLLREVSAGKFDNHTLEAMWTYHILEQLPESFHVFKSLRYASFKDADRIELRSLLADLEMVLRRQEKTASNNAALLVKHSTQSTLGSNNSDSQKPRRRPFCFDGKHNPLTSHTEDQCHQLHPERAIAYYQGLIEKQHQNKDSGHRAHCLTATLLPNSVILDSGASGHYLKDRSLFLTYSECSSSLYGANGALIPIVGSGKASLLLESGEVVINNAYHAPTLSHSLIPLSHYLQLGYTLLPTKTGFKCFRGTENILTGSIIKNLLVIHTQTFRASTTFSKATEWHRALGHPSQKYLKAAFPDQQLQDVDCSSCNVSKMHKQPFPGRFPHPTTKLEVIHMDLCGPITPSSKGGNRYFLKIVDGFSKYCFLFTMERKSQTLDLFQRFLKIAENQTS